MNGDTLQKYRALNPDRPWTDILFGAPAKLRKGLEAMSLHTLRDLLTALDDSRLHALRHFGPKRRTRIVEMLDEAMRRDPETLRFGGARPEDVDELVDCALRLMAPDAATLTERWFLGPETIDDAAAALGMSKGKAWRIVDTAVRRAALRIGDVAAELVGDVRAAIDDGGWVFGLADVRRLGLARDLPRLRLALRLSGWESATLWHEIVLGPGDVEGRLDRLDTALAARGDPRLPLATVRELAVTHAGLRAQEDTLARVLVERYGPDTVVSGMFRYRSIGIGDWARDYLRRAARPVAVTELHHALGDLPSSATRRRVTAKGLMATLIKCDDVFRAGDATYVHESALPIPRARLQAAAEACRPALERASGPVHGELLLREARSAGFDDPELSLRLLMDALRRRPGIAVLPGNRASVGARQAGPRMELIDYVLEVLGSSDRPLGLDEVLSRLPAQQRFGRANLQNCLWCAPQIVSADGKTYLPVRKLGIDGVEVRRLLDGVVDVLPVDGAPVKIDLVVESLHRRGLRIPESTASLLPELLRRHRRANVLPGRLLTRRLDGAPESMPDLVVRVVRDLGPCPTSVIRAGVQERYGFDGPPEAVNTGIRGAVKTGRIRRVAPDTYACS